MPHSINDPLGMDDRRDAARTGLFIAIDANIGAGKTNACHAIASAATAAGHPTRVMEEPTNDPRFRHFLDRYYRDLTSGKNTGGGFAMQMFMLCRRYEQHRLAVELAWGAAGTTVVQDRPIYGDTVFATTAMEREAMSREEYQLYVDVYRNMSRDVMPPDLFVFLDVSPEECFRRMQTRGRDLEANVPLEYLQQLHENYHRLLVEMQRRGVRVLSIDWNDFGPPVEIWKRIQEVVQQDHPWYEQLSVAQSKHPEIPVSPRASQPPSE